MTTSVARRTWRGTVWCRAVWMVMVLAAAVPAWAVDGVGVVGGRVVDGEGAPLSGAEVELGEAVVRSGEDGGFGFGEVAAGSWVVEARTPGFTVGRREVTVAAGETVEVELVLLPVAMALDEVTVSAGYRLLSEGAVAPVALSREEIAALPHFGDDLYRAVTVLPGVVANDFSAAFSVRGGLHGELLVRLDGHELFEPFHLRDFQGVFSTVDPEVVGGAELVPGGFPVEYGDRMTGVLDLTTRAAGETRGSLGISFSNAWANGGGRLADGRGGWLASVRRGYLDVVLNFVGDDDEDEEQPDPRYWDALGRLDWSFGQRHTMGLLVHGSDDALLFEERDESEDTTADTGYGNLLVGLDHHAVVGEDGLVSTSLSLSEVERDRRIDSLDDDEFARVRDVRETRVAALRQEWSWSPGERQYWRWGAEGRRYTTEFDYANDFELEEPLDDPRFLPAAGRTRFSAELRSDDLALWLADRLRLTEAVTLEAGARWDRQERNGGRVDEQVSPRLHLVAALTPRTALRAGWGLFHQSQRPHELAVAFGETELQDAQRAEHWTARWEWRARRGDTLRLDVYRRRVDDPQVRYATLFDPVSPLPEVEQDRIRVAADRVEAEGVEGTWRLPGSGRFGGWLSYAWSRVDDVVDGPQLRKTRQPRAIDQTHAVTWNGRWRAGRRWQVQWVWLYHTGWPTTEITARAVPAPRGLVVVETVGPFYAERLPAYHRLDLRVSRRAPLRRGALTLFLDVQNLYDRDNLRGLDVGDRAVRQLPDGTLEVTYAEVEWLGLLPSFGVSWEF